MRLYIKNTPLMEKYLGKYRIPSNRHQNYDYSTSGAYYLTICTRNREHYFGDVINGKMKLNRIGDFAYEEWFKTPVMRKDMHIGLDEFCIMPNHIHGIIIFYDVTHRDALQCASASVSQNHGPNEFGPQTKNLASIIRGFKGTVKRYANMNGITFEWQPRYHDHIIRNESDYNRIKMYIAENPKNWQKDEYR